LVEEGEAAQNGRTLVEKGNWKKNKKVETQPLSEKESRRRELAFEIYKQFFRDAYDKLSKHPETSQAFHNLLNEITAAKAQLEGLAAQEHHAKTQELTGLNSEIAKKQRILNSIVNRVNKGIKERKFKLINITIRDIEELLG